MKLFTFILLLIVSATALRVEVFSDFSYRVIADPSLQARSSNQNVIARADFDNNITQSGWSFLTVETLSSHSTDEDLARAAGFAEGYATAELMQQQFFNDWGNSPCDEFNVTLCDLVIGWKETNDA